MRGPMKVLAACAVSEAEAKAPAKDIHAGDAKRAAEGDYETKYRPKAMRTFIERCDSHGARDRLNPASEPTRRTIEAQRKKEPALLRGMARSCF